MEIQTGDLTAGTLIYIWTLAQTLGLEYLWFLKDKFAKLEEGQKRAVNAVGLLGATVVIYGLSLADVLDTFTPDVAGAFKALGVLVSALVIGQGVHIGTKGLTFRKQKPSA